MFLDGAAAWLSWQFLPTGRMIQLNNAQTFFQQLKQKYFIYACDNGSDQILFYTAFTHVASAQYQITGHRFDLDYNVDQKRQHIWRDENETVYCTVPSFAQVSALTGNVQAGMSMCDLGAGVMLAGNNKNVGGAGKIYRSTDYGLTWDSGYSTGYAGIYSILSLGSGIVLAVGYYGGPILRSVDYGVIWAEVRHVGVDITVSLCDCSTGVVLCGYNSANPARDMAKHGLWRYMGAGKSIRGRNECVRNPECWQRGGAGCHGGSRGLDLSLHRLWGNVGIPGYARYRDQRVQFIFTLNTLGSGIVLAGTAPNA